MGRLVLAALLIATPAFADDLQDAYKVCQSRHVATSGSGHGGTVSAYQPGFENCDAVVAKFLATVLDPTPLPSTAQQEQALIAKALAQ